MEKGKTTPKSLFNNISNDLCEVKKNLTEMKTSFERKKKKVFLKLYLFKM